jgi:integrase
VDKLREKVEGTMGVRVRQKTKGKGNPWWVFISHNGKRTSWKVGDKKAAEAVASTIRAKLQLGEFGFDDPKPIPTFKEQAKLWLSLPHDWKESTRENYLHNLSNYILPVFGSVSIDKIKRKDLKSFFDKLLSKGVALNTVSLIRSPISGILSHALDSELIENNPIIGLKFIQKKTALEIEPLSKKEIVLLLESAQRYKGGAFYPSILCALRTGMRIGEIRALKWKDLDFENRLIEVKRSCRQGRVTKPKNGKSRRVDMTPQLAETLKALRTTQKRKALQKGRPFGEWVFTNNRGGMLRYKAFRRGLMACLKLAKLRKTRIHDLRHAYATIRLLSGHNIGDVSYQLGHSSIKITYDTYGHWLPGKFKSEVDELDNLHPSAPYTHPKPNGSKNIHSIQKFN